MCTLEIQRERLYEATHQQGPKMRICLLVIDIDRFKICFFGIGGNSHDSKSLNRTWGLLSSPVPRVLVLPGAPHTVPVCPSRATFCTCQENNSFQLQRSTYVYILLLCILAIQIYSGVTCIICAFYGLPFLGTCNNITSHQLQFPR